MGLSAGVDAAPVFVALEERVLGGYRLERRLGRGGMGEVWLGRHQQSRGVAAIKLIKPGAMRNAVGSYLSTEQRAIGRLCHPNIVGLYGVGEDYIICQYVDGIDLARRLRSSIEPAAAIQIGLQIASALAHAHALGVIHRDVKPSNILLDQDGNAYLADFGVARIVDDLEPEARVVGTPAFMAPEQRQGYATPASDQYSLGRTLVVMLTGGRAPLDPLSALDLLPPELPAALRSVLARATDPDPRARFASVDALAAALAAVELTGFPRAVPLAPALRGGNRFAWCTRPHRSEALAHDIVRADYRLSELALPDDEVAALRRLSGLRDIGFAVFGGAARLGPVTDPQAFARATEVIVLLHGMWGSRETWRQLSAACCRANGQAIVIAPDLLGFGESRFSDDTPPKEHFAPPTLPRVVLAFLSVLGLAGIPTVLVGHSAAATSLLSVGDAEIPSYVHRIAITPFFAADSWPVRVGTFFGLWLIRFLCLFPWGKRLSAFAAAQLMRNNTYAPDEQLRGHAEFMAATSGQTFRLLSAYAVTAPAREDRLHRTMIIVVDDDPLAPADFVARMLRRAGLPDEKIFRLGEGAHFPHAVSDFAARNINDIAAVVDTVLDSTRIGATTNRLETGTTATC